MVVELQCSAAGLDAPGLCRARSRHRSCAVAAPFSGGACGELVVVEVGIQMEREREEKVNRAEVDGVVIDRVP